MRLHRVSGLVISLALLGAPATLAQAPTEAKPEAKPAAKAAPKKATAKPTTPKTPKATAKAAKLPQKPVSPPPTTATTTAEAADAAPAVDSSAVAVDATAAAAPAPTTPATTTTTPATAATAATTTTAATATAATPVEAPTPPTPTVPDAPAAPPAERRLVAVLDLKGCEGAAAQAGALTTMLTAEVSAQDGYRAVSRNELQALLAHQSTAQLVGCDEPRCMADVAHLVNADFVVSGSVEKLEGATVVGLTLMDAGTDAAGPTIVSRQETAWRGSDDELLLVMRPLVQRLFDARNAHTHVGAVEVFVPEGARLVLDDKDLGTAPVSAIRDLGTGVHRLQVAKDGYANEVVDLVVSRNETTIVRVDLEEIPLLEQPWFWATAGGVALVAAGTAAGITTYALVTATPPPSRVVLGVKE
jgi:TolB-like protein